MIEYISVSLPSLIHRVGREEVKLERLIRDPFSITLSEFIHVTDSPQAEARTIRFHKDFCSCQLLLISLTK
ncbi:ribosome recycling factor family protein [Shewanella benthica]|nr:hypothetical protein [Shewanella benthica]MCL1061011.1 ribosome recycling factor family protein [Shewanella benthica]